jgi:acyl carrier protein
MSTTADRIRSMIVNDLAWTGSPEQLTVDYPLIENQVLDSLGIYQMVTFIQDEFSIEVDALELVPDNFETIGAIQRLVDEKSV